MALKCDQGAGPALASEERPAVVELRVEARCNELGDYVNNALR